MHNCIIWHRFIQTSQSVFLLHFSCFFPFDSSPKGQPQSKSKSSSRQNFFRILPCSSNRRSPQADRGDRKNFIMHWDLKINKTNIPKYSSSSSSMPSSSSPSGATSTSVLGVFRALLDSPSGKAPSQPSTSFRDWEIKKKKVILEHRRVDKIKCLSKVIWYGNQVLISYNNLNLVGGSRILQSNTSILNSLGIHVFILSIFCKQHCFASYSLPLTVLHSTVIPEQHH